MRGDGIAVLLFLGFLVFLLLQVPFPPRPIQPKALVLQRPDGSAQVIVGPNFK